MDLREYQETKLEKAIMFAVGIMVWSLALSPIVLSGYFVSQTHDPLEDFWLFVQLTIACTALLAFVFSCVLVFLLEGFCGLLSMLLPKCFTRRK